jgi:hypothetical protein
MVWSGEKTIEHAALLVEAQIRGVARPVLMQLDTGCDVNLVYEIPFGQVDPGFPRTGSNQALLAGAIAGRGFEREPFFVRKAGLPWLNRLAASIEQRVATWKGKPVLLGTVGAAFVERRALLLDFVAGKVAILGDGEELPPDMANRMAFSAVERRDRKIFVRAVVNGVEERNLAFDTGSSALPVATTRRQWLRWTGRQADDPKNTALRLWSWDRYLTMTGAPMRGSLCVGAACLESPMAYFEPSGAGRLDFDRYPFPITGVIGNALFDGRFTVVVDLPRSRFGVFGGSLSAEGATRSAP